MTQRIVCWFSHGAASTVAAKLAIELNNQSANPKELVVASIYLKDEHEDNHRYFLECEKFLGQKMEILTCEKYESSVDVVIEKTRYMSGPKGARCTKELKKQVRLDWQRHDDIHVFGMTNDEQDRIDDLIDSENDIQLWPTLIEADYSKDDCFRIIEDNNIRLPEMYHLGYGNNNCKGCLKAQSVGYWNKIRVDFPEVFEVRAEQERLLGVSLARMSANKFINEYPEYFSLMYADAINNKCKIKINSKGAMMIPLRYLPPEAGKLDPIYVPDCGFFCEKAA